jgi:hypothetical protein
MEAVAMYGRLIAESLQQAREAAKRLAELESRARAVSAARRHIVPRGLRVDVVKSVIDS